MDSLRPSIEQYLQHEMGLQELHLGELSWYWAGFLWLQVDKLDFTSQDHSLAFHDGSASVRIPLRSLFNGDISPDKIRLSHGKLDITITNSSALNLPPQLILKDMHINWRFPSTQGSDDWQGELSGIELTLNTKQRSLKATSPALTLSAQWDNDGLPKQLKLTSKNLDWLPTSLHPYINGSAQSSFALLRKASRSWNIQTLFTSEQATEITFPEKSHGYRFNRLEAAIKINLKQQSPQQINVTDLIIHKLQWSLDDQQITAQGQWDHGLLQLKANSDQLPMPLIWSWLKPLGDDSWKHWLSLMQTGLAKQLHGDIALPWPAPLQAWPSKTNIAAMQYQLQAELENADIALGISSGSLVHTRAHVELNQSGLSARIEDTTLPKQLGHSTGTLRIPWDTLLLHISGTSNADVRHLLQWFAPEQTNDWHWNKARANSRFELLWDPSQSSPNEARATLKPDGVWNIHVLKFPIQVSQGEVQWDQQKGLSLKGMHIKSKHMYGILSLEAAHQGDRWQVTALTAKGSGDLAPIAAHFQLPIAHAAGNIRSSLRYDGQRWFGDLDMTQASWEHLLGSDKQAGEIFSLQYQGELNMPPSFDTTGKQDLKTQTSKQLPTIHLNKLTTTGQHIKLRDGAISLNQAGLKAQLNGIHTPSFSGNLAIDIPFDDSMAWKIDAKASYLNRNALPDTLDHPEKLLDKTWLLRADIDRFDWGDAHMSGVHLKLSSDQDSLGIMEAAQVHTSQLDILDVDARFTLPGQGQVELRKFSATFEKQQLTMSATLKPVSDGGMRWTGFAELHGDFGRLMKVGDLSKRFLDGDAHLLFSGQGMILKEQPWWQGLDGRLRMRVDHGRVLEGGTFTTLLSAINIARLPALLLGQRNDLTGPGIMYERLQMEAIMQNQTIRVRNIAMRSSAFDLIGQGTIDVDKNNIDLYLVAKPLQNLDAILSKIPLVRDLLGGRAHSLVRKVYHLVGPFSDAKVESVQPQDAGLAEPGIIERFLSLPSLWFGSGAKNQAH